MSLRLNGSLVPVSAHFPDGTSSMKVCVLDCVDGEATIFWNYEGDHEMPALMYLVGHLRSHECRHIRLFMPYIPNARNDRVHYDYDVFTLKYFCQWLNSLGFDAVYVLDPHSHVAEALIDSVIILDQEPLICEVIDRIGDPDLRLFYPDEGAMKRYSSMIKKPFGYGVKERDWEGGKIKSFTAFGSDHLSGHNVLVVDDICSYGGTFLRAAKALKDIGAKDIYLYATHCENTIHNGKLLKTDLVKHIFTTDSIYKGGQHDKITVLPVDGMCL